MKKSDINQPPCYFDKYITYVEDIDLNEAFNQSLTELNNLAIEKLEQIGNRVYAKNKWTIKDIFQHLIDTEHILAYRALRIARNDKTQLSGFDEAILAANVNTEKRTLANLIAELKILRTATTLLFASFNEEALQRSSVVSGNQMSALAFGFTIVGHQKHHVKIIDEKYV